MTTFSDTEIENIDRIWRTLPADHVWTGWSASGAAPEQIWIFRTKAHWRRFPLKKSEHGYVLFDETGHKVAFAKTLPGLLKRVEALPGLDQPYDATS